jgi:hypothetical protein
LAALGLGFSHRAERAIEASARAVALAQKSQRATWRRRPRMAAESHCVVKRESASVRNVWRSALATTAKAAITLNSEQGEPNSRRALLRVAVRSHPLWCIQAESWTNDQKKAVEAGDRPRLSFDPTTRPSVYLSPPDGDGAEIAAGCQGGNSRTIAESKINGTTRTAPAANKPSLPSRVGW